jgi:hypothetical protein
MPMMSVEASGCIGGLEMKTSRGRHVACRRSISANKATPAQLTHRGKMGRAAHYWTTLSDADRIAWRSLLPSVPDLRAAVIACYLRIPETPGYPITPSPLDVSGFAFLNAIIDWHPDCAPEVIVSHEVAGVKDEPGRAGRKARCQARRPASRASSLRT